MQDASLWSYGLLSVTNGSVDSTNHTKIVSDWIRVSKGSTLSVDSGYKFSCIISKQPITAASYRLENRTLGTGAFVANYDGYIRVGLSLMSNEETDISIRTHLKANIIQNKVSENSLDISIIDDKIDNVQNGLIDSQNGELYFEKILDSYVAITGVITDYAGWERTNYIPVSNIASITITKTTSSNYNIFYDSSKAKVSSFSTPIGTKTIVVPSNAAYVILSDTKVGMESTVITFTSKNENEINNISKSVTVVNPYLQERYIGDTIAGENLEHGGIFFRFDSIEVNTNTGLFTSDWANFLSDLSESFGASNPVNAPVVSYDYTTNCARLNRTYSIVFNVATEKFELVRTLYTYSNTQAIIIGVDNSYVPFGALYEQAKLSEKRGLKCYRDKFLEIEETALTGNHDFMFTFATDCHFPPDDEKSYYNPTNEVIKAIDDNFHVDAIINGGDSDIYGSKKRTYALGCYDHVFKNLPQDKIVYCMGNHDWNGVSGISYQQDEDWMLDNSMTNTLFMRHNTDAVFPASATDDVKYFYRDFTDKKIRVIVLNTSDVDVSFTNGIVDIDPLAALGVRQAQITWLTETALNVPDDDWHIIIFMHVGLYINAEGFPANNALINRESIQAILSAYVNKTTYSYSETDSTYNGYFDISGSGSFANYHGTLVGVFSGHAHTDGYCDDDGFNAIQTECSYLDYNQKPQRLPRTIDEVAVDCVAINKTAKTISITRFGYGDDRSYTY